MISAEEIKKFQKEFQKQEQEKEQLSIEEMELIKIEKEIFEAIIEDSNATSVCVFIGRLSTVAKLKTLGFGIDDISGYGRGLLYVVSW